MDLKAYFDRQTGCSVYTLLRGGWWKTASKLQPASLFGTGKEKEEI